MSLRQAGFLFVAVNSLFSQLSNAFLFAQLHCSLCSVRNRTQVVRELCLDVKLDQKPTGTLITKIIIVPVQGEALLRPQAGPPSLRVPSEMTGLILRAIDFGASVVFLSLCAKAFCVHFYKDIARGLKRLPSSLLITDGHNRR